MVSTEYEKNWDELKQILEEYPWIGERLSMITLNEPRSGLLRLLDAIEAKNLSFILQEVKTKAKEWDTMCVEFQQKKNFQKEEELKKKQKIPSRTQLEAMTIKELNPLLKLMNLSVRGKKAELIEKLLSLSQSE